MMKATLLFSANSRIDGPDDILVSGKDIYAVAGDHGTTSAIVTSNLVDRHVRKLPVKSWLQGLCVDGETWTMGGENGTLFESADGGESWTSIQLATEERLMSVASHDGRLWVCGDGGSCFVRTGGGEFEPFATLAGEIRLVAIGDALYAVGKGIWKLSGDDAAVELESDRALASLAQTATGELVAVCSTGALFRRRTGSWTELDSPAGRSHLSAVVPIGDALLVVEKKSETPFWLSRDGGDSFEALEVVDDAGEAVAVERQLRYGHLSCVVADGHGGALAAGNGGVFFRISEDGLGPWQDEPDRFDRPGELDELFDKLDADTGFGEDLAAVVAALVPPPSEADDDDDDDDDDDRKNWLSAGPADLRNFETVYGFGPPAQLTAFFELWHKFPELDRAFHEWSLYYRRRADGDLWSSREDENLFELSVAYDCTRNALAGLIDIGSLGNGDEYYFDVFTGEIVGFDHERRQHDAIVAKDLFSLVVVNLAFEALDEGKLAAGAFKRCLSRFSGRFAPTWHFCNEDLPLPPDWGKEGRGYRSPERRGMRESIRTVWIDTVLADDDWDEIVDIPDHFVENLNEPLDDDAHRAMLERGKDDHTTTLYGLWRSYLFGNEDRLADFLALAKGHRAKLARDAAATIKRLLDGDKELGEHDDFPERLEEFRALELDPQGRAEREARDAAEKAERETRRKQAADAVRDKKQAGGIAALTELAWEHLEDDALHGAIETAMRAEPSLSMSFSIIDYVQGDGWHHDNSTFSFKRQEACECFAAHGDIVVLPLLVGATRRGMSDDAGEMPGKPEPSGATPPQPYPVSVGNWRYSSHLIAAMVAAYPDEKSRVADAIRPVLDTQERWAHRRTDAAWVLGATADAASVPKLAALLEDCDDDDDFARALVVALGAAGTADAITALEKRLPKELDAYESKALAPMLRILGERGNADSVTAIAAALQDASSDAGVLLEALADIASRLPAVADRAREVATAYLELDRADAYNLLYRTPGWLQCVAACERLGADAGLEAVAARVPDMLSAGTAAHFTGALGHSPVPGLLRVLGAAKLSPNGCRWLAYADDPEVRRLAAALYSDLEPARFAYRFVLDSLFEEGGLDAIIELACAENTVYRYNAVLWLADHGDKAALAPVLELRRWVVERDPRDTSYYEFTRLMRDIGKVIEAYGAEFPKVADNKEANKAFTNAMHERSQREGEHRSAPPPVFDYQFFLYELRHQIAVEHPAPCPPATAIYGAAARPEKNVGVTHYVVGRSDVGPLLQVLEPGKHYGSILQWNNSAESYGESTPSESTTADALIERGVAERIADSFAALVADD